MIRYLLTGGHAYTMKEVVASPQAPQIRLQTYDHLIWSRRLPTATYIFTDLDRLSPSDLDLVALIYRRLQEAGLRVLNNPARVKKRFQLLRALQAAGINDFQVYRAEDLPKEIRFPVFVRKDYSHGRPRTGLLENRAELDRALAHEVSAGVPLESLLVVEYAGEPVRPGIYRKLAVFRMGDTMLATTCVHDTDWLVKQGAMGVAGEELYQDELRMIRENPYANQIRKVFEIAQIEYGRADFGFLNGRLQIFEINTNPHIGPPDEHSFATRKESMQLAWENAVRAFHGLDSPRGPTVILPKDRCLRAHRRWGRFFMRTRLVE